MFTASVGLPTRVPHLRLIVNPDFSERTPTSRDLSAWKVIVNGETFPALVEAPNPLVDSLIADLERRTGKGTIASGTYVYLDHYPRPDKLHAVNTRLEALGIGLELQAHAGSDGRIMGWIQYHRQPMR